SCASTSPWPPRCHRRCARPTISATPIPTPSTGLPSRPIPTPSWLNTQARSCTASKHSINLTPKVPHLMALPQPDASAGDLIDRVAEHLPTTGRLGIAYSGGVDSATLLAIAHHVLGPDRTLAIMAVSPSLASREKAMALDTAAFIGTEVLQIRTNEQAVEGYRDNDVDRC